MRMRAICPALLLSVMVPAGAATAPDPVVFIEVAKGYQGLLWSGRGLPGVLPGTGNGSGFVVDADAALDELGLDESCSLRDEDQLLVVTNEHIARNATELSVTFLWQQEEGTARQFTVPGTVIRRHPRRSLTTCGDRPSDVPSSLRKSRTTYVCILMSLTRRRRLERSSSHAQI